MGFTIFTGKHRWKKNICLTCKIGSDTANTKPAHPQAEEDSGHLRLLKHPGGDPEPPKERCGHSHADSTNASPDTDSHLKT